VSGQALDFCRVVTQRRSVEDTELVRIGAPAEHWLHIPRLSQDLPHLDPDPVQQSWMKCNMEGLNETSHENFTHAKVLPSPSG